VLPYRVTAGQLHVVTAEIPSEAMTRDLAETSNLEIRFRLVRPEEFEALAGVYLPPEPQENSVPALAAPVAR
jgi:hypothetical protein